MKKEISQRDHIGIVTEIMHEKVCFQNNVVLASYFVTDLRGV